MILDDIGAYDLEFTVLLDNSEVYEGVKQIQVFDDQRENLLVEGFTCFILHPGYDLGVYEYYKNEGLYFSPELLKRFREVKRKEILIFSNFKASLRNGTPIKVDPLIFVVQ